MHGEMQTNNANISFMMSALHLNYFLKPKLNSHRLESGDLNFMLNLQYGVGHDGQFKNSPNVN